jgi:hypothetical protein
MFKIGNRVKRVGKGAYPAKYDKFDRPDDSGQGFGLIGTITFVSEEGEWPPGSSRTLPKMYFVQFQGWTGSIGIIEEHLTTDFLEVGNSVTVTTTGSEPKSGKIVELWAGSDLERTTGHFGLDKYHVLFYDGCSGWFYCSDIRKN